MDRRLFIKGSCGAALSLPVFCEETQNVNSNKRLLIFCNHLGFHLPNLIPSEGDSLKNSSPYLDILKKYSNKISVLTNMEYKGKNGHHMSPRALLTGTANSMDAAYSPSIDQFLGKTMQKGASFPSLVTCATSGWDLTGNFSWGLDGKPVFAELDSYALYNKLFKKYSKSEHQYQKNLLDKLHAPISKASKNISSEERERLEVYLGAIRKMEADLESKTKINIRHPYKKKLVKNLKFKNMGLSNLDSQIEMSVFAMINNISNICVTGINHSSGQSFVIDDSKSVNGGYHRLSHHGNRDEMIEELKLIEMAQLSSLAKAVDLLASLPEGNGTMLDNTLIAIFAGHANANSHTVDGRPVILIGGKIKHKGIIDCKGANSSNLLPTLCQAMGKPVKQYANSQSNFNGELL